MKTFFALVILGVFLYTVAGYPNRRADYRRADYGREMVNSQDQVEMQYLGEITDSE